MKVFVADGIGFVGSYRADTLVDSEYDVVIALPRIKALRSTLFIWALSRMLGMKLKSEELPDIPAICVYPTSIAAKFDPTWIGKLKLGWA